jgi:hypothetical protein
VLQATLTSRIHRIALSTFMPPLCGNNDNYR